MQALERIATKRAQLLEGDLKPRFSANALLKDLHLAREARLALDVKTPLLECALAEYERAVELGTGDDDYIAAAVTLERS
jgi:3-hydroxyisobutyrate dehydrogenase-like beta-hydroxyacid dehydrogenase